MPSTSNIYCNSLVVAFGTTLLFLGACARNIEKPAPPAHTPAARSESSAPVEEREQSVVTGRADQSKPAQPPLQTQNLKDSLLGQGEMGRYGGAAMSHYPYQPLPPFYPRPPIIPPGADRFPDKEPSSVLSAAEHPVSTFSVDVDTASYAFVRRSLAGGGIPPREAVRVEELVNYFPYAYPAPEDRTRPFRVTTTVMPSPWNDGKSTAPHRCSRLRHRPRRPPPRQRGAADRHLGLDATRRSPAATATRFPPFCSTTAR